MSIRISERSLYAPIIELFEKIASKYEITIAGVQEVETGRRYPDVLVQINGHRLLIQVKIDRVSKLIEDIVKSYPIAKRYNAELIGILFPSEVRRVIPTELKVIAPKLAVTRALILTEWLSSDFENVYLSQVIESIIKEFVEYKKTLVPIVNYLTIAKIARETIEELSEALRKHMGVDKYFSMAQAIIGRFDFYKSLLEELIEKEEIMKTYVADIIAYIIILQLLFSHVVSIKKYKKSFLPIIDNPLAIPDTLVEDIKRNIESQGLHEVYKGILGSLPYLLEILREIATENRSVLLALGRYVYAIRVLRPEHVREELLGRIYQEGLPPETRKNLGAFFTNPKAAKLLAELAINRWDEKVLDPACGSGTLLVASYWAKTKRAEELGVGIDKDSLHELFIKEHIVGIDVMQFAKELSTINLAFQNIRVTDITPKVYYGDGIEKMIQAVEVEHDDPPTSRSLLNYFKIMMKEYEELKLPREGFDVVIMNPPFTRRERIPEKERNKLEKIFGNIVSGKVGYWAYFFAAADNVIKPHGRLAAVTPEEFFAGRSAESLRRYMLLGERAKYRYKLRYIVRSAIEVAFSEGAHYRDYLVVMEKVPVNTTNNYHNDTMLFIVLKKKKDDLNDKDIEDIISCIRNAENNPHKTLLSSELLDVVKVNNPYNLIKIHIDNLKPLVGFNCTSAQMLFLELLNRIVDLPSLQDLESSNGISIRLYRPGQYRYRGTEGIVQRLIIARYGERSPYLTFRLIKQSADSLKMEFRHGGKTINIESFDNKLIPVLWTCAGVKHLDISSEEEYAMIDPNIIPIDLKRVIAQEGSIARACNDLKYAYNNLASNVLLARRIRITSRNTYWLAFYTNNKTLGIQLPNIIINNDAIKPEILALYLNSTITLIQILAFTAEVEGAWLSLDHKRVWSHIRVPDFNKIDDKDLRYALNVFSQVSKINTKSLYERIMTVDNTQRMIDEAALRLLGLHDWINKLNDLYNAIKCELDAMQKILEKGTRERRKRRSQEVESDKVEKASASRGAISTLDKWLKFK